MVAVPHPADDPARRRRVAGVDVTHALQREVGHVPDGVNSNCFGSL